MNIKNSKAIYIDQNLSATSLNMGILMTFQYHQFSIETDFLNLDEYYNIIFTHVDNNVLKYIEENETKNFYFCLTTKPQIDHKIIKENKILELFDYKYILPSNINDNSFVFDSYKDINNEEIYIITDDFVATWEFIVSYKNIFKQLHIISFSIKEFPIWLQRNLQKCKIQFSFYPISLSDIASNNFLSYLEKEKLIISPTFSISQVDIYLKSLQFSILKPERKIIKNDSFITMNQILNFFDQFKYDINHKQATYNNIINIVCYNPSYLFNDLCNRFIKENCVHSEIPIPQADQYIWMRPQEYIACINYLQNKPIIDVSSSYLKRLNTYNLDFLKENIKELKSKSTVIHHGICPPPIYQFDPITNVLELASVKKVIGVCKFDDCYRDYSHLANSYNFEFCPIGYDNNLFSKNLIKQKTKQARERIKIGFVGKAYGKVNYNKNATKYTAPNGYIKGGDHLINIMLRLKVNNIKFELVIIGNNWEEYCKIMDMYDIPYKYLIRNKNLTYNDYPKEFASLDLLLLPTRGESGPVPAIEAMSMGVPINGCDNGGIINFLSKKTTFCKTFSYDTNWHIADLEAAYKNILEIYNSTITYDDRLNMRKIVEAYTTDKWINYVIQKSKEHI